MTNTAAVRFVHLVHMQDWIHNDELQQLATQLGLTNHWQSRAAYIDARRLAGMAC